MQFMGKDVIEIRDALKSNKTGKSNLILLSELLHHTRITLWEIHKLVMEYCKDECDSKDRTLIVREMHANQSK